MAWAELVLGRVVRNSSHTDSIELAEPLTATDMRMRENDVILGIPKTSYKSDGIKEYFLKLVIKKVSMTKAPFVKDLD